MVCTGVTTVAVVGAALVQQFWVAVPLYLVSTVAFGISMPVKQGWLNARIPSEQRATIISLDALFGDGGIDRRPGRPRLAVAGGLDPVRVAGRRARPGVGVPLLGVARRAERAEPAEPAARPERETRAA